MIQTDCDRKLSIFPVVRTFLSTCGIYSKQTEEAQVRYYAFIHESYSHWVSCILQKQQDAAATNQRRKRWNANTIFYRYGPTSL